MNRSNLFISLLLVATLWTSQASLAIADNSGTDAGFWLSLTKSEKNCYILGFKMGAGKAYRETTDYWLTSGNFKKKPSSKDFSRIKIKINGGPAAKLPNLSEGVSKLYDDPANAYIDLGSAISITIGRLRGVDTERQLREARKEGFDFYQHEAEQKQ